MTIRHLNIFVALYENDGNMTKTASVLYMAQPAISLALSELEDEYEVKLFDRISRRLYVNDAGRKFYGYAKRIINMFDDLEKGMKDQSQTSKLRVGCCDSMDACSLPKYISNFNEIHPGVRVYSTVDVGDALIGKVLGNEVDIAIVDRMVVNRKVICEDFVASKMALGVSPKLGLEDGQVLTLEEFVKYPVLLREKGSGARLTFDAAMANRGHTIEPVCEGVGTTFVLSAALQGLGIVALPKRMMDSYHKRGKLNYIEVEGISLEMVYKIIYHSDRKLTEAAQDFIKMCKELELEMVCEQE